MQSCMMYIAFYMLLSIFIVAIGVHVAVFDEMQLITLYVIQSVWYRLKYWEV